MRTHALALALSAALSVARADLDLDAEDIPAACAVICKPVRELTSICDVNDDRVPDSDTEHLLEAQCICTNDSFDVGRITSLCASCIEQNAKGDDKDDGLEGLNSIMSTCGFSSTSYESASATVGGAITVSAVAPTDADQLTTTITGGTSAPSSTGASTTNSGEPTGTNSANAAPAVAPRGAAFGLDWLAGVYITGLFVVGAAVL